MMNADKTRVHGGGCLCGAVRYEVRGPLRDILVCHCAMCRRLTTDVGAFTACAPENLVVTGRKLRWYRSSPEARRGFCAKCGAQLFWAPTHGRHVSISAGSLDDASGLAVAEHIHLPHAGTAALGIGATRPRSKGAGHDGPAS